MTETTIPYSPGDVVRLTDPVAPGGPWIVLKVLVDGSFLLRQGTERRIASPEEVRR